VEHVDDVARVGVVLFLVVLNAGEQRDIGPDHVAGGQISGLGEVRVLPGDAVVQADGRVGVPPAVADEADPVDLLVGSEHVDTDHGLGVVPLFLDLAVDIEVGQVAVLRAVLVVRLCRVQGAVGFLRRDVELHVADEGVLGLVQIAGDRGLSLMRHALADAVAVVRDGGGGDRHSERRNAQDRDRPAGFHGLLLPGVLRSDGGGLIAPSPCSRQALPGPSPRNVGVILISSSVAGQPFHRMLRPLATRRGEPARAGRLPGVGTPAGASVNYSKVSAGGAKSSRW